uniref:Zmp:0000000652 n=1 Tax=Sinocyclocheilus grahami TaxID=75366 RepID=A0A672M0E5_SINGR
SNPCHNMLLLYNQQWEHLLLAFDDLRREKAVTVSVMEGDSVTLNADLTAVQKYLLIQWMFGSTRIAEADRLTQTNSTYAGPDERFRDRLKLDHQTGSLTITNIRTTDSGLYKVTVISNETSYMRFNLTVYGE